MVDFAQVFERSPHALMVIDREFRYVAVNQEYLDLTASRAEELVGVGLFDRFPHDPDDPANLPARILRASFERVFATGLRESIAYIPYRVPIREGDRVVVRERVFSATHVPLFGSDGSVTHLLQHTVDVSALHEPAGAEEAGRVRVVAGVLDRAEQVQEANRSLEKEAGQLRTLFEQAPGFVAFLEGPEHRFRHANAAYRRLVGGRKLVGRTVGEALPEVRDQGFVDLLDRVYRTGAAYVGNDVRVDLVDPELGGAHEVFLDFVYQPVRGAAGEVTGILVSGHDVTARRVAERARETALRAAEAMSAELQQQSVRVRESLEAAQERIRELEGRLAQ